MSAGKKIWKVGWRLLVGAILLVWIFNAIFTNEAKLATARKGGDWSQLAKTEQWHLAWTSGPAELWHTVASVDTSALLISILVVGITILLGIIRWRMVLEVQGLHLPFLRASEISLVAQCFNSFLLGSTGGDLMKAYYAARETHHKKTEAVTTVFVDRVIGLWSMLFFAAIMMIPNFKLMMDHARLGLMALLVLAMLAGCSAVLAVAFWGGISRHWPTARATLRRLPKGELLERSLQACREFGSRKKFLLQATAVSLALNVVCVIQTVVVARGLGLQTSAAAFFVTVPIIICISALPITPAGLGVRENLFVLMLAVPEINVAKTAALSLSLLVYAGGLFWSVVGGLVYLCLRQGQHLREITATSPAEENG